MLVIGHRGSRIPGPENTVAAVRAALLAGADGVEIDLRRTPSAEVLIRHDPFIDPVGAPSLGEILDACAGRGRVICEIKNVPGQPDFDAPECRTAELALEVFRRRSDAGRGGGRGGDDVVVSSFDWHSLELFRARAPQVATAFLTPPGVGVGAALAYAVGAGHPEIHPHVSAVLADLDAISRAHDAGVSLVAWTVTEVAQARELRGAGADGIICDDPAGIVAGLARP